MGEKSRLPESNDSFLRALRTVLTLFPEAGNDGVQAKESVPKACEKKGLVRVLVDQRDSSMLVELATEESRDSVSARSIG
ncbi:hypothetical protein K2X85_00880 [bacterium]|nr:hypothetical protein [bacterium]